MQKLHAVVLEIGYYSLLHSNELSCSIKDAFNHGIQNLHTQTLLSIFMVDIGQFWLSVYFTHDSETVDWHLVCHMSKMKTSLLGRVCHGVFWKALTEWCGIIQPQLDKTGMPRPGYATVKFQEQQEWDFQIITVQLDSHQQINQRRNCSADISHLYSSHIFPWLQRNWQGTRRQGKGMESCPFTSTQWEGSLGNEGNAWPELFPVWWQHLTSSQLSSIYIPNYWDYWESLRYTSQPDFD